MIVATSRLGAVAKQRATTSVNIDHHASNESFADYNIVEPKTACTGMMIDKLFKALKYALNPVTAGALYAAVVYDTGRFMHSNTSPAVLRFAARLVDAGCDPSAINRAMTYTKTPHDLELTQVGIKNLIIDEQDQRLAGIALSKQTIKKIGAPEDWGDLVEIPRSLHGVEIAFLMRESEDGSVRVSLRSNPPFVVRRYR